MHGLLILKKGLKKIIILQNVPFGKIKMVNPKIQNRQKGLF
jgi:hypothetical protein